MVGILFSMAFGMPLPVLVVECCDAYCATLAQHDVRCLDGLHLVGSVALGNFRDASSDIDFVAVLRQEALEDDLDRLERVHADLNTSGPPHVDGLYVTAERLRTVPVPGEARSFCVDGRFRRSAPCFENNPVVWRCLARHGIAVFGPAADAIHDDPQVLRGFLLDNSTGYWARWLDQAEASLSRKAPGETVNPAAVGWGVLGVARIARTLTTGEIVSKSEAGRWALSAYDGRWHPMIRTALDAREGRTASLSIDAARSCLDFLRHAIGEAGGPLTR